MGRACFRCGTSFGSIGLARSAAAPGSGALPRPCAVTTPLAAAAHTAATHTAAIDRLFMCLALELEFQRSSPTTVNHGGRFAPVTESTKPIREEPVLRLLRGLRAV